MRAHTHTHVCMHAHTIPPFPKVVCVCGLLAWPPIITLDVCWQPLLWPPGAWPPLTEPSALHLDNQSVKRQAMLAPVGLDAASFGNTDPIDYVFQQSLHIKLQPHYYKRAPKCVLLSIHGRWKPYRGPIKNKYFQLHNQVQASPVSSHLVNFDW